MMKPDKNTDMRPLGQLKSDDGFCFIGIDRAGREHYCTVHHGDSGSYYMSSNTIVFDDLIGWIPER
jgi:hypothetical protein